MARSLNKEPNFTMKDSLLAGYNHQLERMLSMIRRVTSKSIEILDAKIQIWTNK